MHKCFYNSHWTEALLVLWNAQQSACNEDATVGAETLGLQIIIMLENAAFDQWVSFTQPLTIWCKRD